MWPFSPKTSYAESGILEGFTDWHCHLLPGVDDGIQTVDETLEVLRLYAQHGVHRVWFTPHVMEDTPNTPEDLRQHFDKLMSIIDQLPEEDAGVKRIKYRLAAEHMMDSLLAERLDEDRVLPIGEEGEMLLVETSYYRPPYDLWGTIDEVKRKGYYPLLAHPERYLYMESRDYDRLHEMGVRFQLNIPSLLGAYGPEARSRAKSLLKKNYYSYRGTDTHRVRQISEGFPARVLKQSFVPLISLLN